MKPLSLKTVGALCAAASITAVACAAVAQPPGGGFGPDGQGGRGGRGGGQAADPAERTQRLHDRLQITAGQEAAFAAWQAALAPKGPPDRASLKALRGATTPQRLDQELTMADERQAELRAHVAATKTFYNQLTPAQRQTMDSLPPQALLALEGGPGPGGRFAGGPGGRGGRGRGGGGNFDPNGGFGGPQPFGGPPEQ